MYYMYVTRKPYVIFLGLIYKPNFESELYLCNRVFQMHFLYEFVIQFRAVARSENPGGGLVVLWLR